MAKQSKSGSKTVFFCGECGNESPRWYGRCPACGAWNSMTEHVVEPEEPSPGAPAARRASTPAPRLDQIEAAAENRVSTGIGELDRVLGGGIADASVVLVGGDPGIGKSTLLLQASAKLASGGTVLYVSAEESARQIKLRADRLGISGGRLHVLSETDIGAILAQRELLRPDLMVVDSIQTVLNPATPSSAGSVAQVRQCAGMLINSAKKNGYACFLVGHVTKEGAIAGPRVLEHMVDAVLYFEGDRRQEYRVLRAVKNRFGSVNEIGVFRMSDHGMDEVSNPSEFFLSGRSAGASGSVVACAMEGTRPVLVDMQALVSPTMLPAPRRQSYGFDHNRLALLLAVLEKRAGLKLYNMDTYVNIAGGIEVDEPAADLPLMAAIASSLSGTPVPPSTVVIGEAGLSGEVRAVNNIERRLSECARMGFTTAVVPQANMRHLTRPDGLRVVGVSSVRQAITAIFTSGGNE